MMLNADLLISNVNVNVGDLSDPDQIIAIYDWLSLRLANAN
jgi:hypothetical protein